MSFLQLTFFVGFCFCQHSYYIYILCTVIDVILYSKTVSSITFAQMNISQSSSRPRELANLNMLLTHICSRTEVKLTYMLRKQTNMIYYGDCQHKMILLTTNSQAHNFI